MNTHEVSSDEAADSARIQRFTLRAIETPLNGRSAGLAKGRTILILGGGHPVESALAGELLAHGYRIAIIREGDDVQEVEAGTYTADLGSLESVTELIALVSHRQGPPNAIAHLLSLLGEPRFTTHRPAVGPRNRGHRAIPATLPSARDSAGAWRHANKGHSHHGSESRSLHSGDPSTADERSYRELAKPRELAALRSNQGATNRFF